MPPRVLILTATVGEGHDLPARTLTAQLEEEHPGVEVITRDGLESLGRLTAWVSEGAPRVVFFRARWVYDAAYWTFSVFPPTRAGTKRLLGRVGRDGLMALIEEARPDVVVSTWPQATEVLGQLRRSGRLTVPVCAAITDLAGMHYWAARGVDLHLVTHPESIAEVREVIGPVPPVRACHGLTIPAFVEPRDPAEARASLGLPVEGKVVLVSGGGWGVGDVESAIQVALAADGVALVVPLCGRNDDLRGDLERRHAGDPRVRVEGFTEVMGDWLAAGDALVHSTGGLTVLEADVRGCPTISYGWGRGHLRLNNAAFERFGLAEVAGDHEELAAALRRALRARKPQDLSMAAEPSAASLVLGLVET